MTDIGKLINGRYEIKREFLRGRFSTLFIGTDKENDSACLVRALNEILPFNEPRMIKDAKTQLMIEGNILKTLSHESLPVVREVIKENDNVFLIYEDLEGVPFDSIIKDEQFKRNEKSLKWLSSHFLGAMDYLHKQQPPIVSGGIHPQGIVLCPDGKPKFIEFGFMTIGLGAPGRTNFRMMGAPRYTSPQQLQGNPPSSADDIYSAGAMLYYICTGEELDRSLDRLLNNETKSLRKFNPRIDPDFEKLVFKMIEPDSSKRYHRVEDIINEFGGRIFSDKSVIIEASAPITTMFTETPPPPEDEAAHKQTVEDILKMEINISDILGKMIFTQEKDQVRATPENTKAGSTFLTRYPKIDLRKVKIDPDVALMLPEKNSQSINGIIMEKNDFDEVTVAVVDPTNTMIYDHIAFISKGKLKPLLFRADPDLIELAQEYIYEMSPDAEKVSWFEFLEKKKYTGVELEIKQDQTQIEMFDKEALEGPVIEATNKIIKEAISIKASDIHLETYDNETILRYRIDGVLHKMNSFDTDMARTIVKRLKILAKADIAQERTTQGGRISVKIAGKEYDMRVSIIPVPHGESMVMRILNKGAFNYTLHDLGFQQDSLTKYLQLLKSPHGMILVSGPTGSGKSTTLYASLKEINSPDRKLLTVEDPIEYEMSGINQVQVNLAPREENRKITFSKALREFLRQDPDVILVGEIRDQETAQIAVQAALTGHLLLSTIHTNDSVGIVTRLRDMGIAPYLVGSVLAGGLAQRLVKKICTHCRFDIKPTHMDLELFKKYNVPVDRLFKGRGCDECHNYGHRGRIGIYEMLQITPELSELISTGANSAEIRRLAESQGMNNLIHDALTKAAEGIITMEEVHRVTIG